MPGMNISQKVFSKSGHRRRVRDINRIRPFHQLSLSSLFYLNRRKFWRKCPFQRFPHLPKLNWGALVPVRIWDLTLCVKPQNNSSIMSNMMQYPISFQKSDKKLSWIFFSLIIFHHLHHHHEHLDSTRIFPWPSILVSDQWQSCIEHIPIISFTGLHHHIHPNDQLHWFSWSNAFFHQ